MKMAGILFAAAGAVLFGITPILAKEISLMGCAGETVVFLRNLFAAAILWGILRLRRRRGKAAGTIGRPVTLRSLYPIAWIALIGQAVTTVLLYRSYDYLPVGTATTIHFMYPVLVFLILGFGFGEKISLSQWLALAVAVAGMACFLERGAVSVPGMGLALLSGVGFAIYLVGIEKAGLAKLDCVELAFYLALFTAVFSLIYAAVTGTLTLRIPVRGYGYAVLVALGTSAFGSMLLQKGIALVGPGLVSVLCMFEPITSIAAGAAAYQERLTGGKAVGCLLILGAVVFVTVREKLQGAVG